MTHSAKETRQQNEWRGKGGGGGVFGQNLRKDGGGG